MARIPYVDADALDSADRYLLERPINLFRALANNVGVLRQWWAFGEWIRWKSTADPRLRELAILTVGIFAQSPYEFSHHVEIAKQFGVTGEDLETLSQFAAGVTSGRFSEAEIDALTAARDLTRDGRLDGELWQRLSSHFGNSVALELVVVIGFYNMVVRVLAAVELDVEPSFEQYLTLLPALPQEPDR